MLFRTGGVLLAGGTRLKEKPEIEDSQQASAPTGVTPEREEGGFEGQVAEVDDATVIAAARFGSRTLQVGPFRWPSNPHCTSSSTTS